MPISLRYVARHISNGHEQISLRSTFGLGNESGRISVEEFSFSILSQNMGLLVSPGEYLGTDREGAVRAIVGHIRDISPDVVGLCEVFADGERETIRGGLSDLYPHFLEGPDEADLASTGRALLLALIEY
jgi:hypothetical protein